MNPKGKGRVFVFDDDADSLQSVMAVLRRDGFDVFPFADPREGLARVEAEGGDVVVTDLRMPGLTGLEVLRHVTKKIPDVPVVILTAYGTVEGAIEAVRAGASDFLLKPVEIPRLRAAVFKALKERGMRREIERLREEAGRPLGIEGIVGSSRAMEEVLRKIRLVAPTRMNVLITGESGTGKELVARGGPRAEPPRRPAVPAAELRGDPGDAPRVRALRPREGGVHGGDRLQAGEVRERRGGDALPRRGRGRLSARSSRSSCAPSSRRR